MQMSTKLVTVLIATALLAGSVMASAADLSVNGGWSSEYIFRGIPQSDSSAFAGLDAELSGFYFGTWAADVGNAGQGLEVDLYAGYAGEWEQLRYAIGVTSYLYTDDFDDRYTEVNLGGGYGDISLDVALGEYDNFSGPTLDYRYYTLAVEHDRLFASISVWGDDYAGEVVEVGYTNTLTVGDSDLIDYSLAIIHTNDIDVQGNLLFGDDTSMVLTISKSFDLN